MFKPAMVRAEIRLSMSEIFMQQEDTQRKKDSWLRCYEHTKNEPSLMEAHPHIRFCFSF